MSASSISSREIAIAMLTSMAFACLMCFPLIIRPDITMVAGKYQWSHAWVMELLHQGLIGNEGISLRQQQWSWNPLEVIDGAGQVSTKTRLIDYPRGGRIVLLGWPQLLLGHQLRQIGLPTLTAFNIAFISILSTAPFFSYLLGRLNQLKPLGSAFGAAIFSASPYMLGILYNGQVAKTSHGFIAALACCAFSLGKGKWQWGFLLAPLLPLCFGASPYYFIFAIPLCAALLLWQVFQQSWKNRIKGAIATIVAIAVGLYGCFPLLYHFKGRIKSLLAPATGGQDAELFGITAKPSALFWPNELLTGAGESIAGEHHIAYLGLTVIILSGLGIILNASKRQFIWLGIALFYILLAFGSSAQAGTPFPLPTDILLELMPEKGSFIMRYRAVVVSMLMLGLLSGSAIQSIQTRFGKNWVWGIMAITLADIWLLPKPPFPVNTERVPLPRVYAEFAQDNEEYGIIEFPCDILGPNSISASYFARLNLLNQKQLFYQIYHRKGLGMVDKANLSREAYQLPLMRELQEKAFGQSIPPMGPAQSDSIAWLRSMGFRYLVLHEHHIPPENRDAVQTFLQEHLSEARYDTDDGIWRYTLNK